MSAVPDSVSRQFLARRDRMLARAPARPAYLLAGAILAFWLWDHWIDPRGAWVSLWPRLIGATLILGAVPHFGRRDWPDVRYRWLHGGVFLVSIWSCGTAVALLDQGMRYGATSVMVFPFVLAFYSLPAGWYLGFCALAAIGLIPLVLLSDATAREAWNAAVFYALAVWIGYVGARVLERQQWRVFLLELRHADEARTDALTGLANRRMVFETGPLWVARAQEQGQALAVALMDVDRFKPINDEYGHDFGDRVLVALAAVMRAALRSSDLLGRIGGEEFLAILPGADPERAAEVAERLRAAVAALRLPERPELGFSISIGLVNLGDLAPDWESLLLRADECLYEAKRGGRDRVVQAERLPVAVR